MTYDRLRRYQRLRTEARAMKDQLADLENFDGMMADTVQGSQASFPFVKRTIKIEGRSESAGKKRGTLRSGLNFALRENKREREIIEAYVYGVTDPVVKSLLIRHILQGRSWRDAANLVYGYGRGNGNTARMICRRYVDKHPGEA